MSDGLWEALEELVRDRENTTSLAASDYVINPYEIRELLASYPPVRGIAEGGGITERLSAALGLTNEGDDPFRRDVIRALEPEIQRIISERTGGGITDEAVEAAYAAYVGDMGVSLHEGLKNALEAAAPLLGLQQVPTVLLDRNAVRRAIADELDGEGVVSYGLAPKLTDRVMDVAQQVPSREEIAEAMHDHWTTTHKWRQGCREDVCIEIFLDRADAVLALFSKPAEEGS